MSALPSDCKSSLRRLRSLLLGRSSIGYRLQSTAYTIAVMSNVAPSQLSYSQQDLQDFVSLALAEARGLGASEAEVGVSVETGLSVTARLREVETLEYQRDRGMGVTVYRGKRKGSASTGDLSARAIRDSVAKAFSIAGFTAEDECAGLPEPDTLAREFPDLDLFHPWSIEP